MVTVTERQSLSAHQAAQPQAQALAGNASFVVNP